MKRFFIVFSLFLCVLPSSAQFCQKGKVMEYHGIDPKTEYHDMVSLSFEGAASTYSKTGLFQLNFNQLNKGELIGSFEIKIGNVNYILFNKSVLQRWILTSDLDMEVLLCQKSQVDNIVKIYTENNIASLKRSYAEALRTIEEKEKISKESKQEIEKLKEEKAALIQHYDQQISALQASAIAFAYVDETKLDSLERLKRYYMLKGETDSALILGRQANYAQSAEMLLNKSMRLDIEKKQTIDQLFNVLECVEQHIDNLKKVKRTQDEIEANTKILLDIYEYLIEQYTYYLRCEGSFLTNLNHKYNTIRNDYAEILLKKGFYYDDFYEAQKILSKALSYAKEEELFDRIHERLESFPDFVYISPEKDTIYCHILEDSASVSICDYHPYLELYEYVLPKITRYEWETRDTVSIPSVVYNNDTKYIVTKIGYGACRNCCVSSWDNSPFSHDHDAAIHTSRSFATVIIPNTVNTIGRQAFMYSLFGEVILPKSIRTIKDEAFTNIWFSARFNLPEGLEYIGEYAFAGDDGISMGKVKEIELLTIPSTLKYMDPHAFDYDIYDKYRFKIHPKNKHYCMINEVVYSADSSIIYENLRGIHWKKQKKVFIPDTYRYEDISLPDTIEEFVTNNTHPLYSTYEGVLYNKDFSKIEKIPNNLKTLKVSPLFKRNRIEKYFYLDLSNISKLVIPETLGDDEKYCLLCLMFQQNAIDYKWPTKQSIKRIAVYNSSAKIQIDKYELIKIAKRLNHFDEVILGQAKSLFKYNGTDAEDIGAELLEIILPKFPDLEAWKYLGDYYFNKKNYNRAIECYWASKVHDIKISNKFSNLGHESYQQKDYENAFIYSNASVRCFENEYAAHNIGVMYRYGRGVDKDILKAIEWYDKAIEWGYIDIPAYQMGKMFFEGTEIPQDYHRARDYFVKAAEKDYPMAWTSLGWIFEHGLTDTVNIESAAECYFLAIHAGDSLNAPYHLARVCKNIALLNDEKQIFEYCKMAADHGHAFAMNDVAYLFARGQGTIKDYKKALEYIEKAIQTSPDNANYYDSKGEIMFMIGAKNIALDLWEKVMEIEPNFAQTHHSVLYLNLLGEGLINELNSVSHDLEWNDQLSINRNRIDYFTTHWTELLHDPRPNSHLRQIANCYYNIKEPMKAIKYLYPNDYIEDRYIYICAADEMGMSFQTEHMLENLIQDKYLLERNRDLISPTTLIWTAELLGRFDLADSIYAQMQKQNIAWNMSDYINYGHMQLKKGCLDSARDYYNSAVEYILQQNSLYKRDIFEPRIKSYFINDLYALQWLNVVKKEYIDTILTTMNIPIRNYYTSASDSTTTRKFLKKLSGEWALQDSSIVMKFDSTIPYIQYTFFNNKTEKGRAITNYRISRRKNKDIYIEEFEKANSFISIGKILTISDKQLTIQIIDNGNKKDENTTRIYHKIRNQVKDNQP